MHCPWSRKTRAWGYEVIRGIDEDDPVRVIRAFRHPVGLAFVDLNTQVETDYGGYVWTQWMHRHFGDTALHIALKWKRHRAVKALLSLRPKWTVPNEAGVTAEHLVLQIYGKDMATFKDEQEREYEKEAMRAEDEAMRRLMTEEQKARDSARQKFLRVLYAARTRGIDREAVILFEHGRVVLADEAAFPGGSCSKRCRRRRRRRPSVAIQSDPEWPSECADHIPATTNGGGGGDSGGDWANNEGNDRWVSHICRELRRNRFAAQRGAMRRNVAPARAPLPAVAVGTSPPLSPVRMATERSIDRGRTDAKSKGSARRSLWSPTSTAKSRISRTGNKRRAKQQQVSRKYAATGQQHLEQEEQRGEGGYHGEDILFDSSSSVGAGRWPCERHPAKPSGVNPGRGRSTSPLGSVSPDSRGHSSKSTRGAGGSTIVLSPASVGRGASMRSGSARGGGKTSTNSPTRFDRSSRMSTMRTTRILAAGKSLRRLTPEVRLQRKMAARSVARAPPATSPAAVAAAGAGTTLVPYNAPDSTPARSRVLLEPAAEMTRDGDGASDTSGTATVAEVSANDAIGRGTGAMPCQDSCTVQTAGAPVRHGGALEAAETGGCGIGVTDREGSGVARDEKACISTGSTTVQSGPETSRVSRSPKDWGSSDRQEDGNFRRADPTAALRSEEAIVKLDAVQSGRHHDGVGHSSVSFDKTNPHRRRSQSCTKPDTDEVNNHQSRIPSTPAKEDVEKILSGVLAGPTRDLLAALLTSTVMAEDGGRILAPSFPSISALHELKYCGPLDVSYASAVGRAISARPGVLVRLSLPGKRIGSEGAIALAPALPSIRIVDLRSNNIGDAGTTAIASALCQHVAAPPGVPAAATTLALRDRQVRSRKRRGNASWGILESLSLAGNRIGDVGATALSDMLGEEDESRMLVAPQCQDGRRAFPESFTRLRSLGWLSVAGNPSISDEARLRLLRAGSQRRVMRSGDDGENNPPPMTVIV